MGPDNALVDSKLNADERHSRIELVSVVVPAFNEGPSLSELYSRTKKTLDEIGLAFEFIVIDDGSTDDTRAIVNALCNAHDNIVLITHHHNHGKSMALMQGFGVARGDVAVTMDADLQDFPEMLPRLLERIAAGKDMVNGWRTNRQDTFSKRIVSKFYNGMTGYILKCSVHDINCGLKAMRRNVYQALELRGDLHRLIPALASSLGFDVDEVPVDHGDRRYGYSKYRLMRHRGVLDIIVVASSQATRARPFHIFFELAVLIFLLIGLPSMFGWFITQVTLGHSELWGNVLSSMFSLAVVWALLTATLLPIMGFVLEMLTARLQDASWRRRLVKEIRYSWQAGSDVD